MGEFSFPSYERSWQVSIFWVRAFGVEERETASGGRRELAVTESAGIVVSFVRIWFLLK